MTTKSDITERRRAEHALRESEERFRAIADNLEEVLALTNADFTQILYVNQAYQKVWGRTPESLYAEPRSWLESVHPEDRPALRDALQKLISGQPVYNVEGRVVRPDGSIAWVACRGFPVRDSSGRIHRLVGCALDRTEQRRAEDAMRESEDRYRDLVEHSYDLICTHDLEGRLLSVNELPARILGYSQEELIKKPMKEFLLPEGHAQFDDYLANVQKNGAARGVMVVLTKTGEHRIWEYHNSLRTDGVTTPVVRGIAHDITEQRRAERALRKSEERFRLMADNINEIFWLLDPKSMGIIYVSPAFEQICERPVASIYANPLSYREMIHPDDASRILGQLVQLEKINELHEQFRIHCPSGAVKWVEVWGFPAKDGAGNITALVGTAQDITERKHAEEALRRSEGLFHAAFDRVAVGFSMTDLQGRFLKVNEAFCRITGYSEKELLNTSYQSITHPGDLSENVKMAALLLAGKANSAVYEKRYIRKSGEHVWVQNSISSLSDGDGKVSGFVALTEDITERKRAEEGIRRLSGNLLQLQDEERRKIARDLHDSTGQDLVALASTLGHLHATIPTANRKLRKSILQCEALANRAIREIRTLSYVLHPPMLDEAGLADAIRHYAAGFAERTGIEVQLKIPHDFGRLAREEEMALFRVMQESLVNIQRHSGSFSAFILLNHTANGVLLEMKDKGRGVPVNGSGPIKGLSFVGGVGIQSMRERMKQVGGRLDIESSPAGTTVRAVVPPHG